MLHCSEVLIWKWVTLFLDKYLFFWIFFSSPKRRRKEVYKTAYENRHLNNREVNNLIYLEREVYETRVSFTNLLLYG